MVRKYSDFSQLSSRQFKQSSPAESPKPASSSGDSVENDALAFFARKLKGRQTESASPAREARDEVAAVKSRLAEAEAECRQENAARVEAESRCAAAESELAKVRKELLRLQGECGRLKGELDRLLADSERPEPLVVRSEKAEENTVRSDAPLLASPANFAETFAGEVREMVIATLTEGLDAAAKGSRERRAAVLSAVLAVNKSSGELERRRAKLKQIFKDFNYKVDPRAFESVGMKLISGRTHWKLQYADICMPISKTPSDYRSSKNAPADMANRCF